ncbi:MFS transporter [Schaalia naturae]|jgi:inositol transporter-like SP family MFS transporter|uniref:MFS transporter n=1 Tax=Schaalia naturae TaxID=635203 RepID=A0ABW2SP48_9ACTO
MSSSEGSAEPKIPATVWFRSGVAGMASYLDAAGIVSTGTALVLFQEPLGLDAAHIGRLSSLLTIMIAAGALVGGRLGDRFGRRRVFTATMVVYALGALLLLTAGSVTTLYIAIPLLGFAVGADLPASLATIAEEAPEGTAGKLIGFSHMLWMIGMAVTMVIQIIVGGMGATGARLLYAHLLVVSLAVLVLRWRLPESEKWTAAHDREVAGLDEGSIDTASLKQLAHAPWLAPMLAVSAFYALVNIAANTNGQFGTYIYVNVAGSTVQIASTISLVTLALSFVMTYVLMRVVDTKYRMPVFAVCAILSLVAFLIPIAFGFKVPMLALQGILYTIGGAIAGEPMFKVWAQELFPTMLRGTAQGIAIAFTRLVAAAVALWTPTVLSAGPRILYGFIAAVVAIGCGLGYFVVGRMRKAEDVVAESESLEGPRPAPVARGSQEA